MPPNSYISTYQGDFGGRQAASKRAGPSLVSRQRMDTSYSAPQAWSSSALGRSHTNPGSNKFSVSEWSNSNTAHYNSADASRHQSERIRSEAMRLMADRERRTVASQRVADHQGWRYFDCLLSYNYLGSGVVSG